MAAQFHQLLAQMHTQVFITIERLVQGRRRRLLTQSDAILHYTVPALKPSALLSRPLLSATDLWQPRWMHGS
jgi:hypothetical protein